MNLPIILISKESMHSSMHLTVMKEVSLLSHMTNISYKVSAKIFILLMKKDVSNIKETSKTTETCLPKNMVIDRLLYYYYKLQ